MWAIRNKNHPELYYSRKTGLCNVTVDKSTLYTTYPDLKRMDCGEEVKVVELTFTATDDMETLKDFVRRHMTMIDPYGSGETLCKSCGAVWTGNYGQHTEHKDKCVTKRALEALKAC